jgi:hypothetical protein
MAKYYISNTGDDALDGLTELTAWKTIGKANTALPAILQDGDEILFKCGDTWAEATGLAIDSSKAIKIASYSTGNKPKITPPTFDYGILISDTGGSGKIILVDNLEFVGNYVGVGIGSPLGDFSNIDLRVTNCYYNLCWSLSSATFTKERHTNCTMDCVDDYALILAVSDSFNQIYIDTCTFNLTGSTEGTGYGFQFLGTNSTLYIQDSIFNISGMTAEHFYLFDSPSLATGCAVNITRCKITATACTKNIGIIDSEWKFTLLMSACLVSGITHGFKTITNGFTTVENCLLYGAGSAVDRFIFNFQNNTNNKIRNCILGNTGTNVINAAGADIAYCISDDNTISGANNYASATLLNEIESVTYSDADYGVPVAGSNAESKGTTPSISTVDFNKTTWNGFTIGAIESGYVSDTIKPMPLRKFALMLGIRL